MLRIEPCVNVLVYNYLLTSLSLSSPWRSFQCLSGPQKAMLRITFRNLNGERRLTASSVYLPVCRFTDIGWDIFCPFVA